MDSILSQKTDFPFVVHVLDDASTDGTSDIVREYAAKYPDKVIPFVRHVNVGAVNNIFEGIRNVKTKYYATVESDDLWCDNGKLQMQVDALEANPDCSQCGHNTVDNYPDSPENPDNGRKFFDYPTGRRAFPKRSGLKSLKTHPSSRVYRTSALSLANLKDKGSVTWDFPSFWYFMAHGSAYYIDRVMSVYNIHGGGTWSGAPHDERKLHEIQNILMINEELDYRYNGFFLSHIKFRRFIKKPRLLRPFRYMKLRYFTKKENLARAYNKIFGIKDE